MINVMDDGVSYAAGSVTIFETLPVIDAVSPNEYDSRSTLISRPRKASSSVIWFDAFFVESPNFQNFAESAFTPSYVLSTVCESL